MSAIIHKQTLTLDASTWTSVTPPYDFNGCEIRNIDEVINVKLRTESGDSSTEEIIGPLEKQTLIVVTKGDYRFKSGANIVYLQAASGAPQVRITWH
jgi:hypothetical protein